MLRCSSTRWLVPIIALVLVAGCSRGPEGASPTSPATPTTAGDLVFLAAPPVPPAKPQGLAFTSKFIRADLGGSVVLGNVAVTFPRGSLPFSTFVTISAHGEGLVGFQVQPANLVLQKPALVTIERLDRTNEKALQALRIYLRRSSNSVPLETRRNGTTIDGVAPALGEFRIGAEDDASAGIQWLYYLDGPGYTTVYVEAAQGGVVACGRYQVTLPAGALAADTYVTVRDPGNRFVSCELQPHGMQFLAPVELQINLHGLRYSPYTGWTIYWLAAPDLWEDQGGTFVDEVVRTNLWHFSTYAPADGGRAGW